MKKSTWIRIHLYCGLFTCFYLIAFGISSIILNHKVDVNQEKVTRVFSGRVRVDSTLDNLSLAESVRDQLGLMGWLPAWEFQRSQDSFHCKLEHLGKSTRLNLSLQTGQVQVLEKPKGLLAVLHGLHFFNGNIPNAPLFLRTWMVYQWMTLFVLLVSLVLGLWLWVRYGYRRWELTIFGGFFLLTCLMFFFL